MRSKSIRRPAWSDEAEAVPADPSPSAVEAKKAPPQPKASRVRTEAKAVTAPRAPRAAKAPKDVKVASAGISETRAGAPPVNRPTIRLHFKLLKEPSKVTTDKMLEKMTELFNGLEIDVVKTGEQDLSSIVSDLEMFLDLEIGLCPQGASDVLTSEQKALFRYRDNVADKSICIYFVRSLVNNGLGCSTHPRNMPAAVVASTATVWTLAHEVCHVLGLGHPSDKDPRRLMFDGGSIDITEPPPDLTEKELKKIREHDLTN